MSSTVGAGDPVRGRVRLVVRHPAEFSSVTLQWGMRGGPGGAWRYLPQRELAARAELHTLVPAAHQLAFEVEAPRYPPSGGGKVVQVTWILEVVAWRGPRGAERATRTVTIQPSSAPVPEADRARFAGRSLDLESRIGPRALGSLISLGAFVVLQGGVVLLRGQWLTGLALIFAPPLAFALWIGARAAWNRLARTHIGDVFVSVPKVAYLDQGGFPVEVHLDPELKADVGRITATLVGGEARVVREGQAKRDTRLVKRSITRSEVSLQPGARPGVWTSTVPLQERLPASLDLGYDGKIDYWVEVAIQIPSWPDWFHRYPVRIERVSPRAPVQIRLGATRAQSSCPYCRDTLEGLPREALLQCGDCKTVFHAECIHELRRCTTRGCSRSQAHERARA